MSTCAVVNHDQGITENGELISDQVIENWNGDDNNLANYNYNEGMLISRRYLLHASAET